MRLRVRLAAVLLAAVAPVARAVDDPAFPDRYAAWRGTKVLAGTLRVEGAADESTATAEVRFQAVRKDRGGVPVFIGKLTGRATVHTKRIAYDPGGDIVGKGEHYCNGPVTVGQSGPRESTVVFELDPTRGTLWVSMTVQLDCTGDEQLQLVPSWGKKVGDVVPLDEGERAGLDEAARLREVSPPKQESSLGAYLTGPLDLPVEPKLDVTGAARVIAVASIVDGLYTDGTLSVRGGALAADPGGPYAVTRGQRVTLDASGSRGDISAYEWTFAAADPKQQPLRAGAKKAGKRVQVRLLQDTKVTLTVTGPNGSDRADVLVTVTPREFRTRFEPSEEWRKLPPVKDDRESSIVRALTILPVFEVNGFGPGVGFSMCPRESIATLPEWLVKLSHVIHVEGGRDDDTNFWAGKAYELERVDDPLGPNDRDWFVRKPLFTTTSGAWMSPYYTLAGPPPPGAPENWWKANESLRARKEAGEANAKKTGDPYFDDTDPDPLGPGDYNPLAYFEAALQHERTHRLVLAEHLAKKDPAQTIEALWDRDEQTLKRRVYDALGEADTALNEVGRDLDLEANAPRYDTLWQGKILIWNGKEWRPRPDWIWGKR